MGVTVDPLVWPPVARLPRAARRRRVRGACAGSCAGLVGSSRRVRRLSGPDRDVHALAGAAVHGPVGRARHPRRARAVVSSGLSGTRPAAAPLRRAARPAGHRRGARHPRALRPRRAPGRCGRLGRRRAMAGHLRPVRHPGRAYLLQPAAGDAAAAGGAGDRAAGPVAARGAARHAARRGVPADRMAGPAQGDPRRRGAGLHALRHFLHARADAGRRAGGDHAGGRDLPSAALRLRACAGGRADPDADRADDRRGGGNGAARGQHDRRRQFTCRGPAFFADAPC